MNCTAQQWLNASACANCSTCSPPLVTAIPCRAAADTVCRTCLAGLAAVNDTCVVPQSSDDLRNVALFMLAVMEILVCACAWRWWARQRADYQRVGI